ncbi:MAG: undecaprenyl-diphosphate phosphatase [Ruminococcaceae bacterium]|nr:undecaprenyl-diphosphate phosphatase [Oscillospiraceae bacterium]
MFIEILKAFFLGVVQGITEWLPVSSTGHMILFDEFVELDVSPEFMEMFRVVIQFGSILAVLILYWNTLFPWSRGKTKDEQNKTWKLWLKIVIAAIPAAIVGLLFDDLLDKYLYNYVTVAAALIVYGVVFIVIERKHKNKVYRTNSVHDMSNLTSLEVGAFQMLSLIPGTSRSGSTIIGAMCVGVSRTAAAEFSFFLAIPVMFGASLLKIVKYVSDYGVAFSTTEIVVMIVGIITAFVVSLVAIKFLIGFVRRHSFESFGWYRIILGAVVLIYFIFTR